MSQLLNAKTKWSKGTERVNTSTYQWVLSDHEEP